MDLSAKVKKRAFELGANLVGIASVDRFDSAPDGKKPGDILPGAQSVVVLGIRLLDGSVQAIFRMLEEGKKHIHGTYATYASTIAPNLHMGHAIYSLAHYIEKETGEVAVPTTSGPFQSDSAFSQRRAAVAAGLAQMGWNGYALTPEFGPRVRFCALVTTAKLDPDPLYAGKKLCEPEKCGICVKKCPTGAIPDFGTGKKIETTVGDAAEVYAQRDINRCKVACYGLIEQTATSPSIWSDAPPALVTDFDNLTDESVAESIKALPPSLAALQIYPNWRCDFCLAYCPAGSWHEKFSETGLSTEGEVC